MNRKTDLLSDIFHSLKKLTQSTHTHTFRHIFDLNAVIILFVHLLYRMLCRFVDSYDRIYGMYEFSLEIFMGSIHVI